MVSGVVVRMHAIISLRGPRVKVRAKSSIARHVLEACIVCHCEECPDSPCFIVNPPDYFS